MQYQRISIIGQNGTGKTTLARVLSKQLSLPIVHMDTYIWGPNWKENDRNEAEQKIQNLLILQEGWIAEGYLTYAPEQILQLADLVIYLDYADFRAFWNNIKRWIKHRNRRRPELPEGCEENFKPQSWIKVFNKRGVKQLIRDALEKYPPKNIVCVKSPGELKKFIKTLI
jgi:adenylate kinase family enzyme